MHRRYAEYRPAPWWHRRRRRRYGLFRSARLGTVGWIVFGLLCLTGAVVGYAAGAATGLPTVVSAVAGALGCVLAVVVVDRRRWGRLSTGYSWGGTPEATRHAAAELRRAGVAVEVEERRGGAGIRFRNRDRRWVARGLAELGIRPPPR